MSPHDALLAPHRPLHESLYPAETLHMLRLEGLDASRLAPAHEGAGLLARLLASARRRLEAARERPSEPVGPASAHR